MVKGKFVNWLTEEGLLQLESWARDGLTDEQIALNIGISRSTLHEWKKRFPSISDTLKKGKAVVDIQVENALLKRALGYSTTETIKERIIDGGQSARHGEKVELTEKEWKFAIQYFRNKCCYCGEEMVTPTKDHIIPLFEGGKLERTNVLPCCLKCNSSKKHIKMEDWFRSQPFFDEGRLQKIYDYIDFVTELSDETVGQLVVTKEVTKEVLPDVTAQIFWLKNRKPEIWRDKKDVGVDLEPVVIVNDLKE